METTPLKSSVLTCHTNPSLASFLAPFTDSNTVGNDDDDDCSIASSTEDQELATKTNFSAQYTTGDHNIFNLTAPPLITTASQRALLGAEFPFGVFPGSQQRLICGHIIRSKTILNCSYSFYIDGKLTMLAYKDLKCRKPLYRLFDMSTGANISKKLCNTSTHYLGAVRSNFSKTKVVLQGRRPLKPEFCAIWFHKHSSESAFRQFVVVTPRRLVLSPATTRRNSESDIILKDTLSKDLGFPFLPELAKQRKFSRLIQQYQIICNERTEDRPPLLTNIQVFQSKNPVYENGKYQLNFNHRAAISSVKNFQVIRCQNCSQLATASNSTMTAIALASLTERDPYSILMQMGKVEDHTFNIDFRAPITPIQAFTVALAQLNL